MKRLFPPLNRRRYWSTALLLALVVAVQVLWLVRREQPDAGDFSGPPRSDYALLDFTLHALDEHGQLAFTMSGPQSARHPEDGSMFVTSPDYVLTGDDGPWIGRSDHAWINKEGTELRLAGHVQMEREASIAAAATRIDTADLTAWPRTGKLHTPAPTQIVQPGAVLRGIGMQADLNSKQLELLSDVHATYTAPHQR